MQTQDCTYTNDAGTPPTIVSSHCVTVGTTTIDVPAPVVAYDPFIQTTGTVLLWIIIGFVMARLVLSFK